MTGAEHYRRAEQLLGGRNTPNVGAATPDQAIAMAQVHATLALAAATDLALDGPEATA